MKTILYLSKFQKTQSEAYLNSLDITPDEIVEWDGSHDSLPEEYSISSLPCLVVDPEGAVEEETITDKDGKETVSEKQMEVKKFEYRKGETKIKTKVQAIQARVKK